MKLAKTIFAVSAATVAVLSAQAASARVVCNRAGDCWRTSNMEHYPSTLGVRYYNDRYADQAYRDRRWRNAHRMWHDEDHMRDHGYYRDGAWVSF